MNAHKVREASEWRAIAAERGAEIAKLQRRLSSCRKKLRESSRLRMEALAEITQRGSLIDRLNRDSQNDRERMSRLLTTIKRGEDKLKVAAELW